MTPITSRWTAWRLGPLSGRLPRRAGRLALLILLALAGLMLAGLMLGSYPMDPLAALAGRGDPIAQVLMQGYRLPRVAVAAGAGAALGLAGALCQRTLGNPLASPDVIGFTAGATVGALAMRFAGLAELQVPGAIAGGLVTAALVLWFGRAPGERGGLAPLRLVLNGIAISLMCGALANLLMARLPVLEAAGITSWLAGSLKGATPEAARLLWLGLLPLAGLALAMGFALVRLDAGEDLARAQGLQPGRVRRGAIGLAVALSALAVSVAGPLPFVAFAAPPAARGLARALGLPVGGAGLIPAAAMGALFVLAADLAARTLPLGTALPAGTLTALFGAPVLLATLARAAKRGESR